MSTCPAYNICSGSRGPHERRLLCVLRAVARRRGRHLRTRRNAQSGRPDRAIQAECARADSRRQAEGLLHSGAEALFTRSSALLFSVLSSLSCPVLTARTQFTRIRADLKHKVAHH